MPYNFVAVTQSNFVADFLQAKCDFTRKKSVLRFSAPFRGAQRKTGPDCLCDS